MLLNIIYAAHRIWCHFLSPLEIQIVYSSRADLATHRDINAWIDKSHPRHLFSIRLTQGTLNPTISTTQSRLVEYPSRVAQAWPPTTDKQQLVRNGSELTVPATILSEFSGSASSWKSQEWEISGSTSFPQWIWQETVGLSDLQDSWKVWRFCQKGHNMSVMVWSTTSSRYRYHWQIDSL